MNNPTTRHPAQCCSLQEVRDQIDNIDAAIVELLALRRDYVHEVVKYKQHTPEAFEAHERRQAVLDTRRQWATELGVNPDMVTDLYQTIIRHFIAEEKKMAQLTL